MKRSIKNIIMILIIIVMGVLSYFTMKDVQNTNNSSAAQSQMPTQNQGGENSNMGEPPAKPEGESGEQTNTENSSTKPEMTSQNGDNSNMGEPPAKPEGESGEQANTENSNSTKPEMPSQNQNGDNGNMGEPPAKPDGENDNQNMGEPPARPDEQDSNQSQIKTIHYIMFGMEGFISSIFAIYLIMSKFNKIGLKAVLNRPSNVIVFIVLIIIFTILLTIAQVAITNKLFITENQVEQREMQMMPAGNSSAASVTKTGATTVDGTEQTLNQSYTTDQSDESAILVQNGGNATIEGAEVSKTGGDSSNTENSEFYGVNAGILVTENSTATIKNATISTNAKGSNAVFSTGTDSKIYISDSKITTTGSGSSRGLDATYGGYIEANNVTIKTSGGSSATLATDRGEGTVIAKNSKLETNGSGSPVIYSTGDISIENTEGTANGSQMVVIEGKNSATVTNSTLTASGKGNREDTDQAGIMIYQSMSGDAGQGTGTFTATNSSLTVQESSSYYKTVPMFFITNTDAIINLTNCKLAYGSNTLISSKGTSEWGKTGSNGGNVTLNADNQTLEGNIEIDNISTLKMNLTNSQYKGTINADNTAKEITLKLDSNSKITLTGDSYITALEDSDSTYSNIDFNGYKLYVNGTAIN